LIKIHSNKSIITNFSEYGTNCDFGVGCNRHVISILPTDLAWTADNFTANFSGTIEAATGDSGCTPPGDSTTICPRFTWTYEVFDVATTYAVTSNISTSIPKNSLKSSINIKQWSFAADSTGLRIKISLYGVNQKPSFHLQPSNKVPTGPQTGFDGVSLVTDSVNAEVDFLRYGIIDGSGASTPLNISGPYDHPFDRNARVFYVDIPVFRSSFEWDPTLYFVEGSNNSGRLENFLFLCLMATMILILI